MTLETELSALQDQHRIRINKNFQKILEYCDKYPKIKTFVEALLNDPKGDLKHLCYEIGYHLVPGSVSWSDELLGMIGNAFLDDTYWTIRLSSGYNGWRGARESDDCKCTQDPLVLIEAAKENRAFYDLADASNEGFFFLIEHPFKSAHPLLEPFTKNPNHIPDPS